MQDSVSVIVVTIGYDDPNQIPSVRALREQEHEFELIVRRDPGIATARNRGIEAASNEKIVFLDDDSIPHANYLAEASEALDQHPVVTGRVLQPPSDVRPKDTTLYDHGDEPKTVRSVIGCNMAFRKEVFEAVGYFDDRFRWGHEEFELSERVRREYDIHYEPKMAVTHAIAKSRREYFRKEYLKGVSDTILWEIRGTPRYRRAIRCSPWIRPQGDLLETLGMVPRKLGRLRGTLDGVFGNREPSRGVNR